MLRQLQFFQAPSNLIFKTQRFVLRAAVCAFVSPVNPEDDVFTRWLALHLARGVLACEPKTPLPHTELFYGHTRINRANPVYCGARPPSDVMRSSRASQRAYRELLCTSSWYD
jgi:hypothetical protein